MRTEFPGFPPEAMSFFRGLKRNNNREWFQARKPIFDEKVRAPMERLVEAVNASLIRFAPDYVTEPGKAIYRIYRDTRFSRNRIPYKTQIAAVFTRRGLSKNGSAGLYFSVSPEEIEVAGGVYMPDREQLLAIRNCLAGQYAEFRRILARKGLRTLMGGLWGEQLSRVPKGFPAGHPADDLLRHKQWLVYVLLDPGIATTPDLTGEIVSRFRAMVPFVEFLNKPLSRKRSETSVENFFGGRDRPTLS